MTSVEATEQVYEEPEMPEATETSKWGRYIYPSIEKSKVEVVFRLSRWGCITDLRCTV